MLYSISKNLIVKELNGNEGRGLMKVSYKKLWKLLIDLDVNKKTLADKAGISASTLTKLTKGECVHMDMLVKICNALKCDLHDIVELVPENYTFELNKRIGSHTNV